jgi:hypothetical protein
MRRLALYIVYEYTVIPTFCMVSLYVLSRQYPIYRIWLTFGLAVVACAIGYLARAICPPALRPRIATSRPPPGTLVTWRGILGIAGALVFALGLALIFYGLSSGGLIRLIVESEARILSPALILGVYLVAAPVAILDFVVKRDRLRRMEGQDVSLPDQKARGA